MAYEPNGQPNRVGGYEPGKGQDLPKRVGRRKFWKLWKDVGFRKDVLDVSAPENEGTDNYSPLSQNLNSISPPTKDSPASAVDFLLHNRGYNLYETDFYPSSKMSEFGKWRGEARFTSDEESSDIALLDSHFDSSYWNTLITGKRTKDIGVWESIQKNLQQIGGIMAGSVLNPIRDTPFIRAKLFGPAIDFRRIVGNIEFITEETYRINKDTNTDDERKMGEYPEGVTPKLMELSYSEESVSFKLYRGGIQATYDFLNSNQTTVARIRNAIEEIGIYHRIALFELVVTTIKAALKDDTDYKATAARSDGALLWTQWRDFVKSFGSFYSPDIMLCRADESTVWESMQIPTAAGTIAVGNLASTSPQLGSNPYVLNNIPMIPEYGWYDDLPMDSTGLAPREFLTFDRDRSSIIIFQRGSDQDETEREPGPRVVTRYLATKAGAYSPDNNGIRTLTYS